MRSRSLLRSRAGAVSAAVAAAVVILVAHVDAQPDRRRGRVAGISPSSTPTKRVARPWDVRFAGAFVHRAQVDDALRGIRIEQQPFRAAERVIVVSVDGLRPDAIGELTPTLRRMAREGGSARRARTLARSITLPSHVSMLTGVLVDRHGIGFNSHKPGRKAQYPSVFRIARRAGLRTAMFVGKKKLSHVVHPGDLERLELGGAYCTLVNRRALPWIQSIEQGLAFIHYADPDGAGHREGWMTPRYERAIQRTDGCIRDLLEALGGTSGLRNTLVIVTSDHGGHDRTHGSDRSEDVHIPWITYGGAAVKRRISREVHTTDTAATVLEALGLPRPHGMMGQPVRGAFRSVLLPLTRPATPRRRVSR